MQEPRIGEVPPQEALNALRADRQAVLIDVRTRPEWTYVGIPDLGDMPNPFLLVQWQSWPDMKENPRFVETVMEELRGREPEKLFFLCRSGVRSRHAARAVALHLQGLGRRGECLNVTGGFEGDRNAEGHRGKRNGWKVAGLPWRQG